MIDLHSHVLAGIDDGPPTVEGSLAIARAAAAAGTTTLLATPHVSAHYPNDADTIARAAERVRAALGGRPPVELVAGAEVAYTRVAELEDAQLERLRLGGGPWVLLEPPFSSRAPGFDATVAELHRRGHRVLIAHPERCPAFQREPALVESLIDAGALGSLTAGSLVGRFGGPTRRFALELLEAGLVHNVASDAHDVQQRPPTIAPELLEAGAAALQDWLTLEVPGAILAGADIPRRPSAALSAPRRRWGRLRRAS